MKHIIILFGIFLVLARLTFAGNEIEIKEIKNNNGELIRIEYIENESGQLKNSINISELNPYKNLNYPIIKRQLGSEIRNVYDLSESNRDRLYNQFLSKTNYPDSLQNLLSFKFAYEFTTIGKFKQYRFVQYRILFFNEEECPIGQNFSVTIINPSGEIISSILNSNLSFSEGVITNNERFFACRDAAPDGPFCYSTLPPTTASIYNLETGEQIFSVVGKSDWGINYPTVRQDYDFIIIRYNNRNGYQYNIFFPEKRKVYSRFFTKDEKNDIVRIEEGGIILKSSNGEEIIESYESTFKVENF